MALIEIRIHLIECNPGQKGVGGGFHQEICVLFVHEDKKSLADLNILENLATSLS